MRIDRLSTAAIRDAFTEEVAAHAGHVTDTFHDGARLFVRSTLPLAEEVRPRDRIQGGVALRATAEEVRVHPYVFRLVCKNGAIRATATQTRVLADVQAMEPDEALLAVRDAVRACCDPDAFTHAAEQMRTAAEVEADMALMLMPLLATLPPEMAGQVLDQVMGRFTADGDRSRYGLMNAVTATARDTRDPDLRWRLEEFGGNVPALVRPPGRRPGAGARRADLVAVG